MISYRVISELDAYLIAEGKHYDLYRKLGAHRIREGALDGIAFAVWAPSARAVSVIGDFNGWDTGAHPMDVVHACGVWQCFVDGAREGQRYKFAIWGPDGALLPFKADPIAFSSELRPATASIVTELDLDPPEEWHPAQHRAAPVSVYEVHLGSWKRKPEEGNRFLGYRELADELL
ncbi:MAG: GlgB N-terminal domain-containing protein, partial [Vulcanimicrobiaceae bacterium]